MKAALRGSAFAKAQPTARGLIGHPAEEQGDRGAPDPSPRAGRPLAPGRE